jgi:hypothetical protein
VRRSWSAVVLAIVSVLGASLVTSSAAAPSAAPPPPKGAPAPSGTRGASSFPPDRHTYNRPATPNEAKTAAHLPVGYSVVDTIVSNTDPTLVNSDVQGDSEPSLAVNANNPNQIAAYTFTNSWGTTSPVGMWYSSNGGTTWTKEINWPPPTGVNAAGCPCDVTLDYDRSNRLFGTALNEPPTGGDLYTGDTTDPTSLPAWSWYAPGGVAQKSDLFNGGANEADQPWLRINRDPMTASQDDTYVGYDDFTPSPQTIRVTSAHGTAPPQFDVDQSPGNQGGFGTNPGTRLAADHSNGTMYVVWQFATGSATDGFGTYRTICYALSRSIDAGNTWTLDSSNTGVCMANNVPSTQPTPKFGTVNALLGGVDAISVDPTNGDVYLVYGNRDGATGNNRLAIRRLTTNGSGVMTPGPEHFVTGQVQAALPSVAVAANGTIGVLYDTYDGMNGSGFPVFTAHLAQSTDQGTSFSDVPLVQFASPAKDNGDSRQRVLGDYQQLRSVGNTFYGISPVSGAAFGRTTVNIDPIFIKAPANQIFNWTAQNSVDFDGNHITDLGALYRGLSPADSLWYAPGTFQIYFGQTTDIPVPGDYNGDGKTDAVIFRPSTGLWYGPQTGAAAIVIQQIVGQPGDIPIPGDYDGDGKTDPAIYRPSTGMFFAVLSGGGTKSSTFGAPGDIPVPRDYDGDGITDFAIYRQNATPDHLGLWYAPLSGGGVYQIYFGAPGDKAVPGDYDGDGKAEAVIFRNSTGLWYGPKSSGGLFQQIVGQPGDIPIPGYYDNNLSMDAAYYRPSTGLWFSVLSGGGTARVDGLGTPTDVAVQKRPTLAGGQ